MHSQSNRHRVSHPQQIPVSVHKLYGAIRNNTNRKTKLLIERKEPTPQSCYSKWFTSRVQNKINNKELSSYT